jgi:histidyl-tRNA synthetase
MNLTNFKLDPFLVRGMDYYTGLLFEVTYNDSKIIESTIAAGGRYDNMIGEFSNKASSIPAIGMSLGIERIAKILEQTWPKSKKRCPDIYVASIGENMIVERVALCSELRDMGYYAVMSDLLNPKMRSQFTSVFEEYGDTIPVMVCIGNKEIMDGMLTVKNVKLSIQKTLKKDDALEFIRDILSLST